ncbi:MAG: xylulokinase [Planctomycetes bacterium]|nr:xylulokinase [Planctomycetota bacterium]
MGWITIGIDCGTQGVKAVALDVDSGRLLASARRPLELIANLPPGAMEQHPHDWFEATSSVVDEVCQALGARRSEVKAIGVSGQQHGFVPLDERNAVIRPAKLWCDTHTQREADQLLQRLGGLQRAITTLGNGVPVGFTASKILWLREHEPANWARLARVLLPHDYLNFRLTGRLCMEAGDASGTALFDVRARRFSEAAITAIDPALPEAFPELVPANEPIGTLLPELAAAWNVPSDVLVSPGGGDNMMGAIGTGNVRPGVVTCSLGTSGTLYAFAEQPVVDPRGEVAAFCDSTGAFLPLVCTLSCTTAIEHVRGLLGHDLVTFEGLAMRAPAGCDGLTFHPTFEGERTPALPEATGSWFGLRGATMHAEHLARSAYEGATLALVQGLDRLRDLGVDPTSIRLTGGGSHSTLWRQIAASMFAVPCEGLANEEGAALGAALQAAWMLTKARDRTALEALCDHVVHVDAETRTEPDPATVSRYAHVAELYRSVQSSLREAYGDHRHLVADLHRSTSREQHS